MHTAEYELFAGFDLVIQIHKKEEGNYNYKRCNKAELIAVFKKMVHGVTSIALPHLFVPAGGVFFPDSPCFTGLGFLHTDPYSLSINSRL
jgi:hypothetical protein